MLTPEYCVTMARYTIWQNRQLATAFGRLDEAALWADRGGFFASILGTANHVLWADQVWLARLAGHAGPGLSIPDSPNMTKTGAAWQVARQQTDAAILTWAEGLGPDDLTNDLVWYSGALGAEVVRPRALCALHLFNHGTHHRGQIHAMLTSVGCAAPTTDLAFMDPADGQL